MKRVKLIIKLLFIPFAFYIIFQKIDIKEVESIKFQHPLFLLFAFVVFNISQFVSALRIQSYLKDINITPAFKTQLVLYYVGMFYNTLLPGGIGGDAYKAYKFQKEFQTGYKIIVKALLIDRISGLFAIFTLIGVLVLFSSFKGVWFAALLAVVSPFLLYFIHRFFFKEFRFSPFFYSLLIQTFQGFSFFLILISLGVRGHFGDFVLLFFISSIISVIPLSVGGVGLRELTFLYGLEFLHLNSALGVVSAFVFFLISLLSSLIGAFFLNFEIRSENV